MLKQNTQSPKILHFFTKVDTDEYNYLPTIRPDAYIAIKDPTKKTQRYFLDIFDEITPFFVIKRRIQSYMTYVNNGGWSEQTTEPLPFILLVCSQDTVKKYLSRYISKKLDEDNVDNIKFFITTKQIIKETDMSTNIWEKIIV